MVELDRRKLGRSVAVFVVVGKGDVEVNGPPGRNVNNFITIAIRSLSNTEIEAENLHGVRFFVLVEKGRLVVGLECDSRWSAGVLHQQDQQR